MLVATAECDASGGGGSSSSSSSSGGGGIVSCTIRSSTATGTQSLLAHKPHWHTQTQVRLAGLQLLRMHSSTSAHTRSRRSHTSEESSPLMAATTSASLLPLAHSSTFCASAFTVAASCFSAPMSDEKSSCLWLSRYANHRVGMATWGGGEERGREGA